MREVRALPLVGEPLDAPSAGYSGTPLLQKLGIKPGHRVALLGAPIPPPGALVVMPPGVVLEHELGEPDLDVVVLFAVERAGLAGRFQAAAEHLRSNGGLWVAWPKRASGVPTDLTEDRVREIALAAGLVDNKVCAIDAVWSGLRCVYRLTDRAKGRSI